MFIDSAKIYVRSGNGGNGCVSFRREKFVAAGGPDGGDGGKGGDIIFKVDSNINTLMDFRYKRKYHAGNGQDGMGKKCIGKDGESIIIKVPPGTIIKDAHNNEILADMVHDGQSWLAAGGGLGGWGNTRFATATRQVPRFAKPGYLGKERDLLLELKLLADVGLIGFPNVGKSTLLSVVSAALPKIANYHFTTLAPNLGVVNLEKGKSFVIADIPGLIEGAHKGVGLGHEFLKHIERTRILIHIIDISGMEGRNPIEDFDIINKELKEYNEHLAKIPQIVAVNKIDLLTTETNMIEFKEKVEKEAYKVFNISAITKKGVRELMLYVASKLKELPPPITFKEDNDIKNIVHSSINEEGFNIRKEAGIYIAEGKRLERIVNSINFEDSESLQYFQIALKKSGLIKELEDMGIEEGDTVRLSNIEFDYIK